MRGFFMPSDAPKVQISIPAYNAGNHLVELCKELLELSYTVVVCDDGSCPPVMLPNDERLHLIRHERNLGKAAAIRTLVLHALHSGAVAALFMDADGQHPAGCVPAFLSMAKESPGALILGNRFAGGGKIPIQRRLAIRMADFALGMILRKKITDSQCGMRLIPSHLFPLILKDNSPGFVAETKMILDTVRNGIRLESVPVPAIYHQQAGSNFRAIADSLLVARCLAREFLYVFDESKTKGFPKKNVTSTAVASSLEA